MRSLIGNHVCMNLGKKGAGDRGERPIALKEIISQIDFKTYF